MPPRQLVPTDRLREGGTIARKFTAYASSLPQIEVRPSAWTRRPAFFLDGREICHFHAPRELDVRLTRIVLRDLRPMVEADPRLKPRPNRSDWVALRITNDYDLEFACELFHLAYHANIGDLRLRRIHTAESRRS